MAGSSSNWFKPASGALKGRAVYLSREQQAQLGGREKAARVLALATGTSRDGPLARQALQLADRDRPDGVAQRGGVRRATFQRAERPSLVKARAVRVDAPDVSGDTGALRAWAGAIRAVYADDGRPAPGGYDHTWSGDAELFMVTQQRGFHGAPTRVSRAEMDALVAGGAEELWRGVMAADPDDDPATRRSGRELAQSLIDGPYYAGYGMYGGGTYFASSRDSDDPLAARIVAQAFTRSGSGPGGVVRAVLSSGARVVDYDQLRSEASAWYGETLSRISTDQRAGRISAADARDALDAARRAYDETSAFAALKGYDAVRVPRGRDTGGRLDGGAEPAQLIVLNRTALIVEDSARAPTDLSFPR